MERRALLKMIAVLTGGALVGAEAFLNGCKNPAATADTWSQADLSLLDEIGETILPTTASSPGAKAAKIGAFMNKIVNDCYEEKDQKAFKEGMGKIDNDCQKKTGKSFMNCSAEERHNFLLALEKEAKEFNRVKAEKERVEKEKNKDFKGLPNHYFSYMKQLTLWGYFTSEIGYTQALRYMAVPGRYDGAVPYTRGEKAWA